MRTKCVLPDEVPLRSKDDMVRAEGFVWLVRCRSSTVDPPHRRHCLRGCHARGRGCGRYRQEIGRARVFKGEPRFDGCCACVRSCRHVHGRVAVTNAAYIAESATTHKRWGLLAARRVGNTAGIFQQPRYTKPHSSRHGEVGVIHDEPSAAFHERL